MASMYPPKKNTAFNLYFSLYKSDGTVIANPGTYTKKISKDGGAVADIATAVTEVDTTYGILKLPLTATEMNADVVMVHIKDDTTGCVPYVASLYTSAYTNDEIGADLAAVHTHINDLHDTDIPDLHTDIGSLLTNVADLHTDVGGVNTDTDEILTRLPDATAGGTGGLAIVGSAMRLTASYSNSIDDFVDGVYEEATADHETAGTFGLAIGSGASDISTVESGWTDLTTKMTTTEAAVTNATYGLDAIHTDLGNISVDGGGLTATQESTLNLLSNPVYGLSAIHTDLGITYGEVATIGGIVDNLHETDIPLIPSRTADAVLDSYLAAHQISGTVGNQLTVTDNRLINTKQVVDDNHTDINSIVSIVTNILKWFTNRRTVSDSQQILYDDDDTTPLYNQTLSDNGTTVVRGKSS